MNRLPRSLPGALAMLGACGAIAIAVFRATLAILPSPAGVADALLQRGIDAAEPATDAAVMVHAAAPPGRDG